MDRQLGKNDEGRVVKFNRRPFTDQEKKVILTKSNCRCAHCGKELTVGDMTVEHIVPVSQGGTNDFKNLVALCWDCNQGKGSLVVDPLLYYTYLKDGYMQQVSEIFSRYTSNANNIDITNLMSMDVFKADRDAIDFFEEMERKYRKVKDMTFTKAIMYMKNLYKTCSIYRALYRDMDDVYKFYVKQLKNRQGSQVSKDQRKGIKNGLSEIFENTCIYIIRDQYSDIIAAFTIGGVRESSNSSGLYNLLISNIEIKYVKHVRFVYEIIHYEFISRVARIAELDFLPVSYHVIDSKNGVRFLRLVSGGEWVLDRSMRDTLHKVGDHYYFDTMCIMTDEDREDDTVPKEIMERARVNYKDPESKSQKWLRGLMGVVDVKSNRYNIEEDGYIYVSRVNND